MTIRKRNRFNLKFFVTDSIQNVITTYKVEGDYSYTDLLITVNMIFCVTWSNNTSIKLSDVFEYLKWMHTVRVKRSILSQAYQINLIFQQVIRKWGSLVLQEKFGDENEFWQ